MELLAKDDLEAIQKQEQYENALKEQNKKNERINKRRRRNFDGPPVGDARTHFCMNTYAFYGMLTIFMSSFIYLISAIFMGEKVQRDAE